MKEIKTILKSMIETVTNITKNLLQNEKASLLSVPAGQLLIGVIKHITIKHKKHIINT